MAMNRGLHQTIRERRIMVLFQKMLPNRDGDARGWHKTRGILRGEKGEKRSFGDVIVLDTELACSPLAMAAILSHELGHVLWHENRASHRPLPKDVILPDNSTISSEENWCDYLAGKQLQKMGYHRNTLHKGAGNREWGQWRKFDDILRYKSGLYEDSCAAGKPPAQGAVWVEGYTRSDGTQVKGYFRSCPTH